MLPSLPLGSAQGTQYMMGRGRNKFHAVRTTVDGITFDSKAEAARWLDLRLLEKAGKIVGLKRQVPFPLVVNGLLITTYIADYTYTDTLTGDVVTEDCKSPATITPEFRLKMKLLSALHGINVSIHMSGKPLWVLDASKGRWKRRTRPPASPKTRERGVTSRGSC